MARKGPTPPIGKEVNTALAQGLEETGLGRPLR